jgi:hypothetical protein
MSVTGCIRVSLVDKDTVFQIEMPTNSDMARVGRRAKILERKVWKYVQSHGVAPLRRISERFGISEDHAFSIVQAGRREEIHATRERKLIREVRGAYGRNSSQAQLIREIEAEQQAASARETRELQQLSEMLRQSTPE